MELRPQAGPLYPDSRLQRRAPESHTVIHMHIITCSHTHIGGEEEEEEGGKQKKKQKQTQTLIHTLL